MELRQLAYLVAVVDEASFTAAAAREHVAQPGISAQIRRLERELGQPLLDRSGRSVRTTAVGAAVLPYARAALAAVDGARAVVDELTGLLRGHIALGMVTSHNVDLPTLLAEFHDAFPAVEITLAERDSEQLIDAVRDGRLDAAIVALGADPPPHDLDVHVITDERIVAAVSPHHELAAAHATITLSALQGRTLIALPAGTGIRSHLDRAAHRVGTSLRIGFEASTPSMLADLAARGLGVAILPFSLAAARHDLHVLEITEPPLHGRLVFAWRRAGQSPATRAFVHHTRRTLT